MGGNQRDRVYRLLAVLLAILPAAARASQALPDEHGSHVYRAVRVATPPTLDGDLSDPVWSSAI